MGHAADEFGGSRSKFMLVALTTVLLGTITLIDYLTGYEISFAVFYLVPVALVAWWGNRTLAISLALASSLMWYLAESASGYPYSHPLIPIWNASVRLMFFLIIGVLISLQRQRLVNEKLLARTDALTNLPNRRAFRDQLERDLQISARSRSPLTLAYIDLDDFKYINDTYGHSEGDAVLRVFSRTLIANTRRSDTAARVGGDEFAIILPATDVLGARSLIWHIRQSLETQTLSFPPVACSIGAIVFLDTPADADEAISLADKLMYSAKNSGAKNAHVIGAELGYKDLESDSNASGASRECLAHSKQDGRRRVPSGTRIPSRAGF